MSRDLVVQRSQIIDIPIAQFFSTNSYPIPDQPMLRDKRVYAICVYTNTDIPFSPVTGTRVTTSGELLQGFITIYTGDPENEQDTGEYVYRMPLVRLHTMQDAAGAPFNRGVTYFDDLNIMWDKCEIYFPIVPNPATAYSIVLEVFYTSRKSRISKLLGKKLSGVGDGTFIEMLMAKLMDMERKLETMLRGGK